MASKSKKRRRVLGASCILAALIIAGSSFAWFTSKDEVTNRLTATADYGVSIVEDFTPPKDMTPGQKVNKDVSAVNTGNVDALVRLALEHEIDYSKLTAKALNATVSTVSETYSNASGDTSSTAAVAPGSYTLGSHTAPDGYPNYLYTTYAYTFTPPIATSPSELVKLDPRQYIDSDGNLHANELTTLQAGGEVVVAASTSVAPTSQFPVRSGDDTNSGTGIDIIYDLGTAYQYGTGSETTQYVYASGTKYYAVIKNADGTYTKKPADNTGEMNSSVDSAKVRAATVIGVTEDYSGVLQYKKATEGLYIFRRSADISGTGAGATDNNNAKYSGFYYDGTDFYALETEDDKVTLKSSDTTTPKPAVGVDAKGIVNQINVSYLVEEKGITLDTTGVTLSQTQGTLDYNSATGGTTFTATGTDWNVIKVQFTKDTKDVIFYVVLDADWDDSWTYVSGLTASTDPKAANGYGYFYYNKTLASGETSTKLVDHVILDSSMKSENYLNLTYDLNVILDSIQVTKDEYNNEVATQVDGWATPKATNKAGTTPTEIASIAWSNV